MANMWRSTIQWLGLGSDEEYDDYDPENEGSPAGSASRHPRHEPAEAAPAAPVRPIAREPEPEPEPQAPAADPRPRNGVVRQLAPQPSSAKPHAVSPTSFNEAQEVADKFMAGVPVIMNLQGAEKDLSRRLVDFASGLCYGLRGQMERVTNQVYLLTPSNVEVSDETRRRLQDAGT
jgi:cell division inhibitor SepF